LSMASQLAPRRWLLTEPPNERLWDAESVTTTVHRTVVDLVTGSLGVADL